MSRRLCSPRVSGVLVLLAVVVLLPALSGGAGTERALAGEGPPPPACKERCVRTWKIHYRTHRGIRRLAYVLLPRWYGPRRHPPIPLVISPHGRGVGARVNARMWRGLPAEGVFAVVNPQGEGRRCRSTRGAIEVRSRTSRGCQRSSGVHFPGCTSTGGGSTPSGRAWAGRRRCCSSPATPGSWPVLRRSTR